MKLNTFDRPSLKLLSAEIDALLKPLAEKYGIRVSMAGGSFSPVEWTAKIKFNVTETSSAESNDYNLMLSRLVGFEENIVGKTITHKGQTHTIVSIHPNKKYSVSCGGFSFQPDHIKRLLNIQPKGGQA